jgi:tRNA nucleotidyltransferase (CCA-adding enzyme)
MAVLSGKDNGPAGRTDAVCAKTVCEADALVCDPVDIRRAIDPAAVSAHSMCGMIIRHDKNDIWPGRDIFFGFLTGWAQGKKKTNDREKKCFSFFHDPS